MVPRNFQHRHRHTPHSTCCILCVHPACHTGCYADGQPYVTLYYRASLHIHNRQHHSIALLPPNLGFRSTHLRYVGSGSLCAATGTESLCHHRQFGYGRRSWGARSNLAYRPGDLCGVPASRRGWRCFSLVGGDTRLRHAQYLSVCSGRTGSCRFRVVCYHSRYRAAPSVTATCSTSSALAHDLGRLGYWCISIDLGSPQTHMVALRPDCR